MYIITNKFYPIDNSIRVVYNDPFQNIKSISESPNYKNVSNISGIRGKKLRNLIEGTQSYTISPAVRKFSPPENNEQHKRWLVLLEQNNKVSVQGKSGESYTSIVSETSESWVEVCEEGNHHPPRKFRRSNGGMLNTPNYKPSWWIVPYKEVLMDVNPSEELRNHMKDSEATKHPKIEAVVEEMIAQHVLEEGDSYPFVRELVCAIAKTLDQIDNPHWVFRALHEYYYQKTNSLNEDNKLNASSHSKNVEAHLDHLLEVQFPTVSKSQKINVALAGNAVTPAAEEWIIRRCIDAIS